jgi:hypothetical protein
MLFLYDNHTHHSTYKNCIVRVRDNVAITSIMSEVVVLVLGQWAAPSGITGLDRLVLMRGAPTTSFALKVCRFVGASHCCMFEYLQEVTAPVVIV